jgi:hypothetical protein
MNRPLRGLTSSVLTIWMPSKNRTSYLPHNRSRSTYDSFKSSRLSEPSRKLVPLDRAGALTIVVCRAHLYLCRKHVDMRSDRLSWTSHSCWVPRKRLAQFSCQRSFTAQATPQARLLRPSLNSLIEAVADSTSQATHLGRGGINYAVCFKTLTRIYHELEK